jgi:diguanylate cyclase (GGDEF)-like protein/PAS domain S-box-containing protein
MGSLRNRYILFATLSYLVLALLWILLSDQLLSLVTDVNELLWLSTAKGIFFVLATTLGFLFVLRAMPESDAANSGRLQDVIFSGAPIQRTSPWLTYSFAIIITLLMLVVRLNMELSLEKRPLMILYSVPIILSALLGGLGPGLLSTIISAICTDYFLLTPQYSFKIADKYDLLQWSTLIFSGLIVSFFSEMLMRMRAKSENNLRLLNVAVSGSKDGVFVKDKHGRYLVVNQAASHFVGQPVADILGMHDADLFPESTAQMISQHDQQVMQSGTTQELEEQVVSFDGKKTVFDVTKGPMFDAQGNVIGLFGISRDVTAFKQAQAELIDRDFKLSAIVNSSPAVLSMKDIDGRYVLANPNLLQIHHLTEAELIGKFDTDLYPEEFSTQLIKNDRRILKSLKRHSFEERLPIHGEIHTFMTTIFPVLNEEGAAQFICRISLDITESKNKNEILLKSEARLQEAHRLAKMGDWTWDIETNTHIWSGETYRIYGLSPSSSPLDFHDLQPFFTPQSWKQLSGAVNHALVSGEDYECDAEIIRQEGSRCWITARGKGVLSPEGKVKSLHSTIQDITERKQAEIELQIAAVAFESQDSVMVTDASFNILKVNQAFTDIFGYTAEEVVGKPAKLLRSDQQERAFYVEVWHKINTTGFWKGEIVNRHKSGRLISNLLSISAVKDKYGVVTHYVGSHIDITERKADADKVLHIAFHDLLTQLPNRQQFNDRLKEAITSSENTTKISALLMIDLDNFKTLNDTLGHDIGDLLLQQVAERLTSSVRDGDLVARLGGDEFVILLEGLSEDMSEATKMAKLVGDKVLKVLNKPYRLAMHQYQSSSSIGITLFKGNQLTISELLKQADISMYAAKKSGRNLLCFFDPVMQESFNNRAALEIELRKAIDLQQFQLYYQIQVVEGGRPFGAEALIRWPHPERGMISPLEFIPLAEETGLILSIGQWVLETACAQLAQWKNNSKTRDLILSVNVSATQFCQADFVETVQRILKKHDIPPYHLKLELTETVLLENIQSVIHSMSTLESSGILFSLDDFGTGYSSLQYLKTLPFDQLKIDQSFVRDIDTNINDRAIVRTIVAMADSLGFDVIAEGVETEAQKRLLMESGCYHFQGYLFGRPLPIEKFEAALID